MILYIFVQYDQNWVCTVQYMSVSVNVYKKVSFHLILNVVFVTFYIVPYQFFIQKQLIFIFIGFFCCRCFHFIFSHSAVSFPSAIFSFYTVIIIMMMIIISMWSSNHPESPLFLLSFISLLRLFFLTFFFCTTKNHKLVIISVSTFIWSVNVRGESIYANWNVLYRII